MASLYINEMRPQTSIIDDKIIYITKSFVLFRVFEYFINSDKNRTVSTLLLENVNTWMHVRNNKILMNGFKINSKECELAIPSRGIDPNFGQVRYQAV